jgi:hypothetical protein
VKFRASIVFEFNADTTSDAGRKVDDVLSHARETSQMDAKSVDVVTPPGSPAVTLPASVTGAAVTLPPPPTG